MTKGKDSSNIVVVGKASKGQLIAINYFHVFSVLLVLFIGIHGVFSMLNFGLPGMAIATGLFTTAFLWYFLGSVFQCMATIRLLKDYNSSNYLALEIYMRKTTKIFEMIPCKKEPYLTFLYYYTSYTQQLQGKHKDAIEQIEKINLKHISSKGMRYPYLATELSNLAFSLCRINKLDDALKEVEKSISICNERKEKDRHGLIYPLTVKGSIFLKQEKLNESLKAAKDALKVINSIKKPPLWMVPVSIEQYKMTNVCNIAIASILKGDASKVELHVMQLESIYNQTPDVVAPFHFSELTQLANCLKGIERSDLAHKLLQIIYGKAAQIPFHPDIPSMLDIYEEVLKLEGREGEVNNMRAWLLPMKG